MLTTAIILAKRAEARRKAAGMKIYFFPYGVGEIVDAPTSKTWTVKFGDRVATVLRVECLAWGAQ
jgi:hypothetical protein